MASSGTSVRGPAPPASSTVVPSVVVFNINASSDPLLSDTPILASWADAKLTGFVKRGRPRKQLQTARSSEKKSISRHVNENNKVPSNTTATFNFINSTPNTPQGPNPNVRKFVRKNAMLDFRRRERGSQLACTPTQQEYDPAQTGEIVPAAIPSSNSSDATKAQERRMEHKRLEYDTQQHENFGAGVDLGVRCVISNSLLLPREIGDVDPFEVFPVKIRPYMLDALTKYATIIYEKMYSIEKYAAINPVKDCWLPMAFQDSALLHMIVACSDIYTSPNSTPHTTTLTHMNKAIKLVNERLSGTTPNITDETIVIVCTLAYSASANNNQENWKIHMRGLKQMVRIRGGIQAFKSNPMIRNKINRADLCGSLSAVQQPYFGIPRENFLIPPASNFSSHFWGVKSSIELDSRLVQILCHIEHATIHLNLVHLNRTDIHPMTVREEITSLQYALLLFSTGRSDAPGDLVHEVLRLILLVYLITILNEGPLGPPIYNMLVVELADSLKKFNLDDHLEPAFLLWITFIAASIDQNAQTREYFNSCSTKVLSGLGISSWEGAEMVFQSFFWVDKIHSSSFSQVWDSLKL